MSVPSLAHDDVGKSLVPKFQEASSLSIMGQESNLESIRALERQIEEGKGDVIEFKRARNSLLNISVRVPPEILGRIFAWCVAWEQDYSITYETPLAGPERGSFNFLLVCHHWFEVASSTPELWTFWGDTLQDLEKRCRGSRTGPIDLVLNDLYPHWQGTLSAHLQGALQERATRDEIRRIHFLGADPDLFASILASLTLDGEGVRERCIESIILQMGGLLPELSHFFAQSCLSKLQHLHITGTLRNLTWDHWALQTTRLTTLELEFPGTSSPPTASHVVSILVSNPNLQELTLSYLALPRDDESQIRVPLRHLKSIDLEGEFSRIFGMLWRLDLPRALDYIGLRPINPTVEGISQTLGPYMRSQLQHDARFQDRLAVIFNPGFVDIRAVKTSDGLGGPFLDEWTHAEFITCIALRGHTLERTFTLELLALVPHDRVVFLKASHLMDIPEEIFISMPNIETLWLSDVQLSDGFLRPNPGGPHINRKLFPSLRYLHLLGATTKYADWSPLTAYLIHQTSDNQAVSLRMSGNRSYMPQKVVEEINGLVKEFIGGGWGTKEV